MDKPMALEADGDTPLEIHQFLAAPALGVMDLGRGTFAAIHLAAEVLSQEGQAQFGVASQLGPPDLADAPDRSLGPLEWCAPADHFFLRSTSKTEV